MASRKARASSAGSALCIQNHRGAAVEEQGLHARRLRVFGLDGRITIRGPNVLKGIRVYPQPCGRDVHRSQGGSAARPPSPLCGGGRRLRQQGSGRDVVPLGGPGFRKDRDRQEGHSHILHRRCPLPIPFGGHPPPQRGEGRRARSSVRSDNDVRRSALGQCRGPSANTLKGLGHGPFETNVFRDASACRGHWFRGATTPQVARAGQPYAPPTCRRCPPRAPGTACMARMKAAMRGAITAR